MSQRHVLFAAAALATGLAVVTVTTADAAVCRSRLSGSGNGQGVLGKGSEKARSAAQLDWENKAKSRHGSRFASLSKAGDVKWDCKSTVLKATCLVTAKPCR